MPELPEVETVRKVIEPLILNKEIKEVLIFNKGTIITDLNTFASSLKNQKFIKLDRKGKFLIFHLSNNKIMLSHLRMEGKYFFYENNYQRSKHDMVSFEFKDGSRLIYNDVRKFGILGIYDESNFMEVSPINKLGKEPFALKPEELFDKLSKETVAIKEGLLNQSNIAGLGNIYVDETLYACGIHPKTKANLITLEQCKNIIKNSIEILNKAIEEGGSTIKSFHPSKGVDGRMQNRLLVYGHEGEECPKCHTKFRKITVGGRGTTYCPNCQRNIAEPFVVGVTGPIHSGKSTVTKLFVEKGFEKIDSDEIVHYLYKTPEVVSKVKSIFGKEAIYNAEIDRKYLLSRISEDKSLKEKLVAYIHPLVAKEAKKRIAKSKAKGIVFEVPLLVGSGCEDLCDYVVLVNSSLDKREERITREGRDTKNLTNINKSYRLKETEKIASVIIENNGSLSDLSNLVNKIIKNLSIY